MNLGQRSISIVARRFVVVVGDYVASPTIVQSLSHNLLVVLAVLALLVVLAARALLALLALLTLLAV